MTPLALMGALARALPPNAVVVEEAATTHQNVLERLNVFGDATGHFRASRLGAGLGIGLRHRCEARLARAARRGPVG